MRADAATVLPLRRARASGEWTGALIRCGTSRIMVMSSGELPVDEDQRLAALRQRLVGSTGGGGMNGSHYQQNKLAVAAPAASPSAIRFRVFQYDARSGDIKGDVECANAAAGVALFSLLGRLADFDKEGGLHALNEGTGQRITVRLDRTGEPWATSCAIRFEYPEGLRVPVFSGFEALRPLAPASDVGIRIAERGNVFVLADLDPAVATGELLAAISAASAEIARSFGADRRFAAHPKILAYRLQAVGPSHALARALCFYRGEVHASLPGSGAMLLAAFLVRRYSGELGLGEGTSEVTVDLEHAAGLLPVCVRVGTETGGLRITATEYRTPVELLMWGVGPPTWVEAW